MRIRRLSRRSPTHGTRNRPAAGRPPRETPAETAAGTPAETAAGTPAETATGAPAETTARRRRGLVRRLFTWKKLLAATVALCTLLTGGFTVLYFSIDIPEANQLAKAESNVYLYSDGTLAARTGEINRESVPIDRVPEAVRHAFVAAENKSFYDDPGSTRSASPAAWSTPSPARAPRAGPPSPSSTSRTTTSARSRPSPAR
ncbi:hypothetical protein NKH77_11375 [Streptomyces sp. M19]